MNELDRIFADKTVEMAGVYRHVEPEPRRVLWLRELWETSLLGAAIAIAVWIAHNGLMSAGRVVIEWCAAR